MYDSQFLFIVHFLFFNAQFIETVLIMAEIDGNNILAQALKQQVIIHKKLS